MRPIATLLVLLALTPLTAKAALVADPQTLYATMKAAYDKGASQGWGFQAQENYYSTILNAGRAYSLQRPTDPAYGELAALTVQVGAGIHYNPLTNHDAAPWWVREAAVWVTKNSTDENAIQQANDLIARIDAMDNNDMETLTKFADEDATANLKQYPRDSDALLQQLEADWRGWLLTNDPQWRSLAFVRAAQPNFPVANLATTYGPGFTDAARAAVANVPGYTPADRANAKIFTDRLKHVDPLRTIAIVKGVPHDVYLTTLAPADEYFGRFGFSILGIENQLKHINFMLDYNYGNREADETLLVVDAILSMQKVYPADRDMPKLLYDAYTTLGRMTTPETNAAALHMKSLLTVEYQDSTQAKELLDPGEISRAGRMLPVPEKEASMSRKFLDCREFPSENNCTITIAADREDEIVEVAAQHAVHTHKHEDTPELRNMIRSSIREGVPA